MKGYGVCNAGYHTPHKCDVISAIKSLTRFTPVDCYPSSQSYRLMQTKIENRGTHRQGAPEI